jgi:hypothetical protein
MLSPGSRAWPIHSPSLNALRRGVPAEQPPAQLSLTPRFREKLFPNCSPASQQLSLRSRQNPPISRHFL